MVEKRTRVVVYGSSLNMAGVAVSLKADPGLEVVRIDSHSPSARQCLSDLHPTALVFDPNDPATSLDLAFLHQHPGILLIGVDPASDELFVLSGHPQPALSMNDLFEIIHQARPGDGENRGKEDAGRRGRGDTKKKKHVESIQFGIIQDE
jgi:hypothetical protein